MTQDVSQGYGLHCFNMQEMTWDFAMCEELGFSKDLLPEIYPCHAVIGTVTEEAAKESGLCVGIPVVAGGLDAACAALGVGVLHDGETQEQGGQAGGMSICMDHYCADERLILGAHVVPGHWLLQGELQEAAVSCAGWKRNLETGNERKESEGASALWI